MAKGLPKSLSRVPLIRRGIVKLTVPLNEKIEVAGVTGPGMGSVVVADFPPGFVICFGGVSQLVVSGPGTPDLEDDWSGDFGFGTAMGMGGLAGDEVNIVEKTAIGPAVAEASPLTLAVNLDPKLITGPTPIYFNLLIDAPSIDGDVTVDLVGILFVAYHLLSETT